MTSVEYMPHIDLLLQALRVNRERLSSKSKVAIDAKLLRMLIQTAVEKLPFSEEFYAETYPDIGDAASSGQIPDLHRHFVEAGYFEGRLGSPPEVDEDFYTSIYKDVAVAIERGDIGSATEHYLRSGAAEGRVPNATVRPQLEAWMSVLRDAARVGG